MFVNATVSGVSSHAGSGIPGVAVGLSQAGVGVVTNPANFVSNPTGLVGFPVALPFQYGEPFNLSFWLVAQALVGSGDGTASANYLNTAAIRGLQFFDSDMNLIADPVITSESGHNLHHKWSCPGAGAVYAGPHRNRFDCWVRVEEVVFVLDPSKRREGISFIVDLRIRLLVASDALTGRLVASSTGGSV